MTDILLFEGDAVKAPIKAGRKVGSESLLYERNCQPS